MAVTATPIFVQTPKSAYARLTAANTDFTGASAPTTWFTAGANGAKIFEIVVAFEATAAAALINIFLDNATGTQRLFDSIPVVATTVSTTAGYRFNKVYPNFSVIASCVVKCAITVTTGACMVHALYGDY